MANRKQWNQYWCTQFEF